jgi:polar amino acid transport system substrate-binding protein
MRLAVEEYPPFVTAFRKDQGLLTVIARAALKTQNITIKLYFLPGKRALSMAEQGTYDGSFPWADRKERRKSFYYVEPIIEADKEYFFFNRGLEFEWNPKELDYKKISHLKIGAVLGSNYGKDFQTAERKKVIKVQRFPSLVRALKMLSVQRLDLVIAPERAGKAILAAHFKNIVSSLDEKIAILDDPIEMDYLLISKKSPEGEHFKDALDKGLKKIKASGLYDQIIKDYKY